MPAVIKSKKRSAAAMPAGEPTYPSPIYSPAIGKKALEALAPALDRLAEADLVTVRLDVEAATFAALGVAGFVSSPDVRARFALLPREEFDMTFLDELELVCFAALHALAEARAAGALTTTDARLPVEIVREATEIEGRMQALCEYHLSDDPAIRPELDRLRPGTGHRDLANDLLGYARIYELRAGVVKDDRKLYRAGDAARARELAGVMVQRRSTAMTPKAREAYGRYVRVWTLLCRRYDEVRAAALWLWRRSARVQERFPSLFAAGRPNSGRPRKPRKESESGRRRESDGGGSGRVAGGEEAVERPSPEGVEGSPS